MEDQPVLPLPPVRCLTKDQAAEYLGIGVTLLTELGVPAIKFGRRCVYDKVDLDNWLEEYKRRGRAGKEKLWPVKQESTCDRIQGTGGLQQPSRTELEYARALGLKTENKLKRTLPS
ncbi:MAG: helix-turn-helix domain-containing protein [Sulfurimicrobium sp.]|nr:helix-turn-helix domain-containing protein [Sulfurimicrobium sp.]MDP2197049.1 helix-turn-helix domain-containing protein [Sulfurimicrobium sp.]MDP3687565.1 helix-turn-helix domain-containing protein [Sulfurimicrobium sp.]